MPLAAKGLLLETVVLLAFARMAVLLLPFRWVARALGRQATEPPPHEDSERTLQARRISIMVYRASDNVPWTSKCLDQALAAKVMLARRGLATTVYIGVKNDEQGQLAAHAWLRSGTVYVTGGRNRGGFTTISTFSDEGV